MDELEDHLLEANIPGTTVNMIVNQLEYGGGG